ncbi:mRNA interferase MazF [Marinobacterium sp. xm-g-59]|uniref:type II toxin-antitoxin system PemK/MazF family toxin n=1 Tax=Marinobacterium sp. xm-g-59 TaxID=2497748 RepID=UPI0015684848|nr:type II toxin-antitoxin system PemK/MazF family toxin [Marinobacterium sp. xm-g-59]NRP95500.1 mRNA interferase MazF [Marinobacterium sp. xm-g-59]
MYVPEKGDIVLLSFDPSSGKEIIKRRPALVISRRAFNKHTGFVIVAPITSTVRGNALEVELEDTSTKGVILVHQLRSLDGKSRDIKFIEKASKSVTAKVTKIASTIIS